MFRSRAAGLVALAVLAAGVVLPTATASADPTTLIVGAGNADCSDTAAGTGTLAMPYCTIQAATAAAQPGDTVQLSGNGPYPASTVTASGTPGAPITITGADVTIGQLTLDGAHDVVLQGLSTGALQVQDSSDVTLNGLYVSAPANTPSIEISGSSSDVTVSRSSLPATTGGAVKLDQGVQHTVITTNILTPQNDTDTGSGVVLDGATGTAVTSNTFAGVGQALTAGNGSTGLSFENNVVFGGSIQVSADSTDQSTSGYNLFYPPSGTASYNWAGTPYSTVAAFQSATGQGKQDIIGGSPGTAGAATWPSEGWPGIDSADADAPGELPTDFVGNTHVDDLLVPNTGTGSGYVDRGAEEFQDPLRIIPPSLTPQYAPTGYPVTLTSGDTNPWGTPVTRTVDFGDGTPLVTTTAASVQHIYTKAPSSGGAQYTITETEGGQTFHAYAWISPPGPLSDDVRAEEQDANAPLTVTVVDNPASPFAITSCKIGFGDGSPVATQSGSCEGAEHTYAKPGTYTISSTLTDTDGRTANASTKATVGPVFVPVGPVRVLDTRSGLGAPKAKVKAGGVVRLRVNGAAGIAGASSVLLNLTVTDTTGNGYVTAYPDGAKRPTAASLNYRPGQTVANLTDVPVAADGIVDLYASAGTLDLVADAEGYNTLTPAGNGTILMNDATMWGEFRQVLDTRGRAGSPKLGKVGPGGSVTFQALGTTLDVVGGEYEATAVVLNVTETNATAGSYVTAYRSGSSRPATSNLNFSAGETRSTTVVVPVDAQGRVSLYNHAGSVDLIASVEGFYRPLSLNVDPINEPMTPITPVRVLDTRLGTGARKAPMGPTSDLNFKVAGVDGIPADATGVLVNVTAIDSTANGYLTVWGDTSFQPSDSALNFMRGQITPTLLYLPVTHGEAGLYNPYGTVNVTADIEGYSTN